MDVYNAFTGRLEQSGVGSSSTIGTAPGMYSTQITTGPQTLAERYRANVNQPSQSQPTQPSQVSVTNVLPVNTDGGTGKPRVDVIGPFGDAIARGDVSTARQLAMLASQYELDPFLIRDMWQQIADTGQALLKSTSGGGGGGGTPDWYYQGLLEQGARQNELTAQGLQNNRETEKQKILQQLADSQASMTASLSGTYANAALSAIMPGQQYMLGHEPGGIMEDIARLRGEQYTPQQLQGTRFSPNDIYNSYANSQLVQGLIARANQP